MNKDFQERQRYATTAVQSDEAKDQLKKELREFRCSRYPFDVEKCEIEISFANQKRLPVSLFSEALSHHEVANLVPTSVNITIEILGTTTNVTLPSNSADSVRFIRVPENDAALTFHAQLLNLLDSCKLPRWQVAWKSLSGLQWALFLFVFSVLATALMAATTKSGLKTEARALLAKGFAKEDEHRAIELILSLASDYGDQTSPSALPNWFYFSFFSFLAVSIILSFPPRSMVAIGKGAAAIARWHAWTRLVTVTIPAVIVIPLFRSYLYDYLKSLFGHQQ